VELLLLDPPREWLLRPLARPANALKAGEILQLVKPRINRRWPVGSSGVDGPSGRRVTRFASERDTAAGDGSALLQRYARISRCAVYTTHNDPSDGRALSDAAYASRPRERWPPRRPPSFQRIAC